MVRGIGNTHRGGGAQRPENNEPKAPSIEENLKNRLAVVRRNLKAHIRKHPEACLAVLPKTGQNIKLFKKPKEKYLRLIEEEKQLEEALKAEAAAAKPLGLKTKADNTLPLAVQDQAERKKIMEHVDQAFQMLLPLMSSIHPESRVDWQQILDDSCQTLVDLAGKPELTREEAKNYLRELVSICIFIDTECEVAEDLDKSIFENCGDTKDNILNELCEINDFLAYSTKSPTEQEAYRQGSRDSI